jgi:hypothetical protein
MNGSRVSDPMTDWPYVAAIRTLRFCHSALNCSLPAKQHRVVMHVFGWVVANLELPVQGDAERVIPLRSDL